MSGTGLTVTLADGIATLEIDRPPVNYFDVELIGSIAEAAHRLDEDPACRVLLLCAKGKHFCAGADFRGSSAFAADPAASAKALYGHAVDLFSARTPIVAAVQGAAIGGGLGLACAADFRVAEPTTRFAANFALLGTHQGFGLSVSLAEIVGRQKAKDLLLRGASVRGEEALAIGLADRIAEPGTLRETATALARELAAAAPLAVLSIRETLRGDLADRVRTAVERELTEQTRLWQTADSVEGVAAAGERRPPVFRGE